MYLQLSRRQSGKTKRLINEMMFDKNNYDYQILMGISLHSLQLIAKTYPFNNDKVIYCTNIDKFYRFIFEHKNKKIRLYVDEFLYSKIFCDNFNELIINYLPIIKNGYFCSSICNNTKYIYEKLKTYCNNVLTVNFI